MSDGIDLLCEALLATGVDCVFGVPGTQNVPLFDGFRRHRIRTVLSTHELAAAFMANGYFRATGKAAALATIPGPGFTYALTGLAEARLDSAALIYLVGAPATKPGRSFQLQAVDQKSIAGPLVKACFDLSAAVDAERVIRQAHAVALNGEPGPVMVQIDMHALGNDAGGRATNARANEPLRQPEAENAGELSKAFAQAKRPVFYLGQGAYGCAARLERIATSLRIPVATTPSARGIVPEDNPVAMAFDPLRGHVGEANALFDRADLIVALGCKLGHNGSAGFELRLDRDKLVHVDASVDVPGANYDAKLPIVARIEDLIGSLESRTTLSDWTTEELNAVRASLRGEAGQDRDAVISAREKQTPSEFFAWLRQLLPRNAIVVTDSGRHQIFTRRYFDVLSPRGLIVPSDFQSMGFGLPAAIGARLGVVDRTVVAIIGDGGFLMSGLELLTARREGVPLVVFVFNDGYLGQIRAQQWREVGYSHAVKLVNPHYEALAGSLGIDYLRLDTMEPGQIERALASGATTLVEVLVADSLSALAVPALTRTKGAVRAALPQRLREWLKASLRR